MLEADLSSAKLSLQSTVTSALEQQQRQKLESVLAVERAVSETTKSLHTKFDEEKDAITKSFEAERSAHQEAINQAAIRYAALEKELVVAVEEAVAEVSEEKVLEQPATKTVEVEYENSAVESKNQSLSR